MINKAIKATKNIWGNYKVTMTGRVELYFGGCEFLAIEAINKALEENPNLSIHPDSYLSISDILRHRG